MAYTGRTRSSAHHYEAPQPEGRSDHTSLRGRFVQIPTQPESVEALLLACLGESIPGRDRFNDNDQDEIMVSSNFPKRRQFNQIQTESIGTDVSTAPEKQPNHKTDGDGDVEMDSFFSFSDIVPFEHDVDMGSDVIVVPQRPVGGLEQARTNINGEQSTSHRDQINLAFTRQMTETKCLAVQPCVPVQSHLPPIPIGAVELLTFYPMHTLWPAVTMRLTCQSWTDKQKAFVGANARGKAHGPPFDTQLMTVRKQGTIGCKAFFDDQQFSRSKGRDRCNSTEFLLVVAPHGRYDSAACGPPRNKKNQVRYELEHRTLYELGEGIVTWPQGEDAGLLTQAVLWARENDPWGRYTEADIPRLMAKHNFTLPAVAATDKWDRNAGRRVNLMMEEAGMDFLILEEDGTMSKPPRSRETQKHGKASKNKASILSTDEL